MATPAPETAPLKADVSETAPAPLVLTLFGPLRALVAGRPLPPLHSRKSLWLLALLALRQGRPVEREWLAGALWPDADQDQAFASLRPVLSDLRRALGDEGTRLQSFSRHALRLDLTGADVDVLTFDAAIRGGTLPAMERAVALYTGPLLEGCAEEWAPQERRAREEDCLRALGTLAEGALAAGDHDAAAGHSRRSIALDPWRDSARRGLMEALDRGGDRNAALQVYREFVTLLRADPRAAPDAQTGALYARLRAEARGQAAPAALVEVPVPAVAGHLPHPLTDLIGREDERAEVTGLLRRSRLVTLTGPGGIGKTRLALAVAEEAAPGFSGGVCLVALESLPGGAQVAGPVAAALGLKEETGRTPLAGLADHLRPKNLLLVLDNCEHVLGACAALSALLLRECAGVRVLATSREALGVTGEAAWAVPGLAVPDPDHLPAGRATLRAVLPGYEGVRLFVERARAARKDFGLTDANAAAVALVCSQLEGVPLAIELAAARVRALTVAQIAARMPDYLGLLTGGSRAGLPRRQTLRATLDWSHDLLSGPERRLLGRLSVFAGGWSLEAAEWVCWDGEPERILDLLTGLVDRSLVLFSDRAGQGAGRYRLLETVRQYAAERLGGAAAEIRGRHRDWAVLLAEEADPQITGPEQETWLGRLEEEHGNMRAALTWADSDEAGAAAGLRLTAALWQFWLVRGYFGEGRAFLGRALERTGGHRTAVRAGALSGAATLAYHQGDHASARTLYEESLSIFQEVGHQKDGADVRNNLGNLVNTLGDHEAARTLHEGSLSFYREAGDPRGSAESLNCLGNVAYASGDYASAQALYEESLELFRGLGDRTTVAHLLGNLGNVARLRDEPTQARALLEESLRLFEELGDRLGAARTLGNLGDTARRLGEWDLARALLGRSLSITQELGVKVSSAASLNRLGMLAHTQGDDAQAKAFHKESLSICREVGNKTAVAQSLRDLASVLAAQAHTRKAARLWGAAQALGEDAGAPPPDARATHDREVRQARAALGGDAFSAAWEEGRALPWEQAAAYALEEE